MCVVVTGAEVSCVFTVPHTASATTKVEAYVCSIPLRVGLKVKMHHMDHLGMKQQHTKSPFVQLSKLDRVRRRMRNKSSLNFGPQHLKNEF